MLVKILNGSTLISDGYCCLLYMLATYVLYAFFGVIRKSTHTNLYLHQNSHHHPANKHSVLASLVHRAKALCDEDSLAQELEFLTTVFKDNGYSPQQMFILQAPTCL
jgi:hypothetical protein